MTARATRERAAAAEEDSGVPRQRVSGTGSMKAWGRVNPRPTSRLAGAKAKLGRGDSGDE